MAVGSRSPVAAAPVRTAFATSFRRPTLAPSPSCRWQCGLRNTSCLPGRVRSQVDCPPPTYISYGLQNAVVLLVVALDLVLHPVDVLLHLVAQDLLRLDSVREGLQSVVLLHEHVHLVVVLAGHLLVVEG